MVKDKVFSVLRRDEVMLYISVPIQVITRWPHSSDKLAHILLICHLPHFDISDTDIFCHHYEQLWFPLEKFNIQNNFLEGPPSPLKFLKICNENLFYFDHSLISQQGFVLFFICVIIDNKLS